jgi:hypothetical protein
MPPRPPERADRHRILEPHPTALRQPDTAAATSAGELQLNTMAAELKGNASSHPPDPPVSFALLPGSPRTSST